VGRRRYTDICNLFRKFMSWTCRGACKGGGNAHTSFPHSLVSNSPSVEAWPLWREAVVSVSVIVCDPFSTIVTPD
jgi:hypothetical protein